MRDGLPTWINNNNKVRRLVEYGSLVLRPRVMMVIPPTLCLLLFPNG